MSDPKCLFCKVISKEIAAAVVFEDDRSVAFRDINPQAPVHILIIPRKHIHSLDTARAEDEPELGHLFTVAAQLAREEGIDKSGYRTVVNTGPGAGQSVFHVHMHLLGGRTLHWPPG
jgi:histidine triad (HIT) family protein